MVHPDFLVKMVVEVLITMTIDIYESPTDNIIFNEPSSPNF